MPLGMKEEFNMEDYPKHIQRRIIKSFPNSLRGRFILSKALYMAIREAESDPDFRDESDLSDMRFLREHWFNFPDEIFQENPFRRLLNMEKD